MKYRKLGPTGWDVSALALGTWQLADGDYWGPCDGEGDAVGAALDAGINLFDCAEAYGGGESEQRLGKALGIRRDDALIATKVSESHCAPADLRAACEASLSRLGTDRIDLYQVHWPCRDVPFADTYAELAKLKDEGKIRAIGVSNFGAKDLEKWMARGETASDQLGYNLLFRAVEHEIVPACERHGVGILVYMPLLQGLLSGKWGSAEAIPQARRRTRHFSCEREGTRHGEPGCEQLTFKVLGEFLDVSKELGEPPAAVAMAWLLAKPRVTSVIIGGRKAAQVQRNLRAAELELTPDVVARLDAISDPLKEHFGANADFWCGAEESRIK